MLKILYEKLKNKNPKNSWILKKIAISNNRHKSNKVKNKMH